jgi:hypothetical protein
MTSYCHKRITTIGTITLLYMYIGYDGKQWFTKLVIKRSIPFNKNFRLVG